ncbi:MAG TPA: hypothetical protein VII83_00545 [Gaiellaceae bacterium]
MRRFRSQRAKLLVIDIAIGLIWALLIAAAFVFSSGISQFIYVDF